MSLLKIENLSATVGGKKAPLDAGHMLFVPAEVPHAVEPQPGTDLILLVHHLRSAGSAPQPPDGRDKP